MPATLEAVIDDLARVAAGPFTLAGYSMGGRIALHAALALPAGVDRVVLVGASPGIADPQERAARAEADEALAKEILRDGIEPFAERWAANPVLIGQPAEVQEAVRADRLRNTPEGLARALRGLGTGSLPSLWDRLGDLSAPVDLVVGERDVKFRTLAKEMLCRLPSAKLHLVPGAGHAAHLEAPGAVAEIIAARRG